MSGPAAKKQQKRAPIPVLPVSLVGLVSLCIGAWYLMVNQESLMLARSHKELNLLLAQHARAAEYQLKRAKDDETKRDIDEAMRSIESRLPWGRTDGNVDDFLQEKARLAGLNEFRTDFQGMVPGTDVARKKAEERLLMPTKNLKKKDVGLFFHCEYHQLANFTKAIFPKPLTEAAAARLAAEGDGAARAKGDQMLFELVSLDVRRPAETEKLKATPNRINVTMRIRYLYQNPPEEKK
jgi:hypothetical protein